MKLKPLEPDRYPFLDYRRFTFSLGIETPEGIWLSGSTAVRHSAETRTMVVEGDLVEQAAVIFEKIKATLVPAGRTPADLTRLVRYVRADAIAELPDLDTYQRAVIGEVTVSTIIVERLLRDQALIEMEASITDGSGQESLPSIFAENGASAEKILAAQISSLGADEGQVVRFAQFLTQDVKPIDRARSVAVLCPSLPDGSAGLQIEATLAKAEGCAIVHVCEMGDPSVDGIVAQCRDALARLEAKLVAAGSGLDRVIKTTEFIAPRGLPDYRETAAVRRASFAAPYPAATGVICKGFPEPGCLIAIEAVARVGA